MMNKVFTDNGWEDYTYWQTEDKKTLKKIKSAEIWASPMTQMFSV